MGSFVPEKVRYFLIKGKHLTNDSAETRVFEKASSYWFDFWNEVFKTNGANAVVTYDDFLRQDLVSVLEYQNEIIGMQSYCFYDISIPACLNHSYFKRYYPEAFWTGLIQAGNPKFLMTLENLSVNPRYRFRQTSIQFGSVLLDLAIMVARSIGVEAIVTAARKDVPAADIVIKHGGDVIIGDVNHHNTPCDLICMLPNRFTLSERAVERELALGLWASRGSDAASSDLLRIAA